jgi:hypothetical protein
MQKLHWKLSVKLGTKQTPTMHYEGTEYHLGRDQVGAESRAESGAESQPEHLKIEL